MKILIFASLLIMSISLIILPFFMVLNHNDNKLFKNGIFGSICIMVGTIILFVTIYYLTPNIHLH